MMDNGDEDQNLVCEMRILAIISGSMVGVSSANQRTKAGGDRSEKLNSYRR
jgi:hypothetical protein